MLTQKYKLNQEFIIDSGGYYRSSHIDRSIVQLIGDKEFTIILFDEDNYCPMLIEVEGVIYCNRNGKLVVYYGEHIESIIFSRPEYDALIKVDNIEPEKSYEELLDDLVEESKKLQKLIEGINERKADLEKAIELRKKITGK